MGDPYLSTGLVKIGEPIYLSKWETTEAAPTLFHIQSIRDVELFGINVDNYGRFVLERASWEQRFGFNADSLPKMELAAASAASPPPTVIAATQPLDVVAAGLQLTDVPAGYSRQTWKTDESSQIVSHMAIYVQSGTNRSGPFLIASIVMRPTASGQSLSGAVVDALIGGITAGGQLRETSGHSVGEGSRWLSGTLGTGAGSGQVQS